MKTVNITTSSVSYFLFKCSSCKIGRYIFIYSIYRFGLVWGLEEGCDLGNFWWLLDKFSFRTKWHSQLWTETEYKMFSIWQHFGFYILQHFADATISFVWRCMQKTNFWLWFPRGSRIWAIWYLQKLLPSIHLPITNLTLQRVSFKSNTKREHQAYL